MPRGNRTGPEGMGPMTGRAAGYCTGYDTPGFSKGQPRVGGGFGQGRGLGFGRGAGREWRNKYYDTGLAGLQRSRNFANQTFPQQTVPNREPYAQTMSKQQEFDALQQQIEYFENALRDVKIRLNKLETVTAK